MAGSRRSGTAVLLVSLGTVTVRSAVRVGRIAASLTVVRGRAKSGVAVSGSFETGLGVGIVAVVAVAEFDGALFVEFHGTENVHAVEAGTGFEVVALIVIGPAVSARTKVIRVQLFTVQFSAVDSHTV
jgi:hypothetical protein